MLITLQDAKDRYRFTLANFSIMPTHIHLLIKPNDGICLSKIMQWIKTRSARRWNCMHGSKDHLWGDRYFARTVRDEQENKFIMDYIDQNPVVAGLSATPEEWKASGAYYRAKNILGLIDLHPKNQRQPVKLLSPIPTFISKLLPTVQFERILKYFGPYAEAIEKLYRLIPTIPKIGESYYIRKPRIFLRYFTNAMDYFVYEYDGLNTMYGILRYNVYPNTSEFQKVKLSGLLKNEFIELDLSWEVVSDSKFWKTVDN
jgi:putative transposase